VRKHTLKPAGYFVYGVGGMKGKRPYQKPATNYTEQVEKLKSRGLLVSDDAEAAFYLAHLNYYRLRGYWLIFEADTDGHQFKPGSRFEDVLELYLFDRELRLLLMDAIERIEVSVRSHWAYELGHRHGAHAFLEPALAADSTRWANNLISLSKEVKRSDEVFIEHLLTKYEEDYPPIWAVCEVMSLGLLSRWYGNLKPMATRAAIASAYGLDEALLGSWLNHLSSVRNYCAHHARIWNRQFVRIPKVPGKKPMGLSANFAPGSRKLYNTLVILLYWMDMIAPAHSWRERLTALLHRHPTRLPAMGFAPHWAAQPIWNHPLQGTQP
jgi:abortive infection bacteriophage resistance protein